MRSLANSFVCFAACVCVLAACTQPDPRPVEMVVTQVVEKVQTQVVEKQVEITVAVTIKPAPTATARPSSTPSLTPRPSPSAMRPTPHGSPTPDASIPAFPWPPPLPSTSVIVPLELLAGPHGDAILADVDATLTKALDETGYYEKAYFSAPGGFALVTRLEQIEADGKPLDPPGRWSVQIKPMREFSLQKYLEALFSATPGHYRIIAFVITNVPIAEKGAAVSREEAQEWLSRGADVLPSAVGEQSVAEGYKVTALVYQFEQPERGKQAVFVVQGALPGRQHLEQAQLWARLAR